MIHFNFLASRLSKLTSRSRLAAGARRSPRQGKPVRRLTAHVSLLEGRLLMAHARPHAPKASLDTPLEMPLADPNVPGVYNTVSRLSDVLFTGNSDITVPTTKQITFRNNTDNTIYPFLYDANTGAAKGYGYYDPFDAHNQEYRLYIGYSQNNLDYLGLLPHSTITVSVPLVFWDSGRAEIATSTAGFLPKDPNTSKSSAITNPFFFFYKNDNGENHGISARYVGPAAASSDGNGIVMYYHSADKAVNPGVDAPAQLIEFTIRDLNMMMYINQKYPNSIPTDQIKNLVNYDVSYVDHMLLPVAMEATDVPVPNSKVKEPFGWIGTNKTFASLQSVINDFTSDAENNGLGTYFSVNGKNRGWPKFSYPSNVKGGTKIPGGGNILLSSPLANKRSNYNNNRWMLSSGGDEDINQFAGGVFHKNSKQAWVVLTNNDQSRATIRALSPGMTVLGNNSVLLGAIDTVDKANLRVNLKNATMKVDDNSNQSLTFFSNPSDPFAVKLTNVWYSWAKFYQSLPRFKQFKDKTVTANVASDTDNGKSDYRILTFSSPQPDLAVGMQVIPPRGNTLPPLITIMRIAKVDGVTKYYLSMPIPNVTQPKQVDLTFKAPQPIAFATQTTDLFRNIAFGNDDVRKFAAAFAATTYELMSVYSTATIRDAFLPPAIGVVSNVIGGNVGFLPTADPIDYVNISADARDLGKSALRGVPNFMTDTTGWYPDPSLNPANLGYNPFNLDPFVWFVHQKLGLSGYGFSFDDDTSDVNADGAEQLYVAVGGPDGLPNKDEWKPSAQWGPKSSYAEISEGGQGYKGKTIITLENPTVYNQLKADDSSNGVVGAFVSGVGIKSGTRLAATADINKHQFVLSQKADPATHVLLSFSGDPPSQLALGMHAPQASHAVRQGRGKPAK